MNNENDNTFEKYFETYYPQVVKYIFKKILNMEDAEDLAMNSFVSCYQRFDLFDSSKASFATWIFVIANNKIKNYYRDHKINEEINEFHSIQDDFENDILASQYIDSMRDELANALETLPDIQKKIVIHKYFNNKNATEIALIVGLSPGNVRVQLSRALKKLNTYFLDRNIEWEN